MANVVVSRTASPIAWHPAGMTTGMKITATIGCALLALILIVLATSSVDDSQRRQSCEYANGERALNTPVGESASLSDC
jgi:hypothetical protein